MRDPHVSHAPYQPPMLLDRAEHIAAYLKTLSSIQLQLAMQLSPAMAAKTKETLDTWTADVSCQSPAIDTFLGDIYSGLQVRSFDSGDRSYANEHLFILSGLYGVLRALDSIMPYRLEMAYKFSQEPYTNLYAFWGSSIAEALPADRTIINVSSVEYTKAVFPHLKNTEIITPKFMTRDAKTGEPKFVTVHAKVARGAFAHWMIKKRIESTDQLSGFNELNYRYDKSLSSEDEPVFVCDTFGGIGYSVRITKKPKK